MTKGPQVQKMFDNIAGKYDLMNRVMTMGQDQKWRRFVVDKAQVKAGDSALDLATGTGDIALMLSDVCGDDRVVGGDFSLGMLKEAKKRFEQRKISWQACDANKLPFEENSFDAVTFGYLLRNVDDSLRVLKEVHRVLKPGGRVVCLDTTPPAKNFYYPFVKMYFSIGIPVMGKIIANDESAYAYLTGSTMDFHDADTLAAIFEEAGFTQVAYKKFMLGTIGVHWGVK